jgi:hypothetical protein
MVTLLEESSSKKGVEVAVTIFVLLGSLALLHWITKGFGAGEHK